MKINNIIKAISISFILTTAFSGVSHAYRISLTDKEMSVYEKGKLKSDSHRYSALYEVNESDGSLTPIYLKDVNSDWSEQGGTPYNMVFSSTEDSIGRLMHKKNVKYVSHNPNTGTLDVISLSEDGTFITVAIKDDYMNVSHGTWEKIS